MKITKPSISAKITLTVSFICCYSFLFSQVNEQNEISVQSELAGGNVRILYCVGGFGGGNVAASIGDEGILLVDDMYAMMVQKMENHLKSLSDKPIRLVLNTHYHRDHIEGNKVLRKSAVIVAHENVEKQLTKNNKEQAPTDEMMPMIRFSDRISVHFNGEEIQLTHFPNSHTDGDVVVYFTKSKVLHLGDMFFFEMFPAVYTQGGGNIIQLISSLEKVLQEFPADTKVVPGHGKLATMLDLKNYVTMLKETVKIVETEIQKGTSLEQMKTNKVLQTYDALGSGGAQTTDQYLTMLYKLLYIEKK